MNLRRKLTAIVFLLTCSTATSARAVPYFEEVPAGFGAQPCTGAEEGCWTNYLRMTDIDGDGDLDILMPNADGYFAKGSPTPFAVYLNDGEGQLSDGSAAIVDGYVGYARQVAVGDVDGDGDQDLYIPAAWGDADVLLLNDGGTFVDHAATLLPNLHSSAGAARFGDVDNDGDLDLFVSQGWADGGEQPAHLYLNDGAGTLSESTQIPSATVAGQPIDFDLFDADGDFDLDILIDMHGEAARLWLNDGLGAFSEAAFPEQPGLKYGPVACDVDGDGDLDIWTDNAGPNYTEQLLINDGTGRFTDETAARVTGNSGGADDNIVACIDVDGDGDFDAAIGSLSDEERVLKNDGSGRFTLEASAFPSVGDSTLWFEFGDIDGDGRLDCATAQGEGSFLDRLYVGTSNAPVDVLPPTFRAVESLAGPVGGDEQPVVRFAVVDNATTDEGPRLEQAWVRVEIGGVESDVPAVFSGGDLYRAVLPAHDQGAATVSYKACAIDLRGNESCSASATYDVEGAGGAGGAGAGGAGSGEGDDDGCGCMIGAPEGPARPPFALALALCAVGVLVRRRR